MNVSTNTSGQTSVTAERCISIFGKATKSAKSHTDQKISVDKSETVSAFMNATAIVTEKTLLGDWEIDTVIGQNHKGVLVTIVDRLSKFTLIKKVASKPA